jgi:hypothetical protein
LIVLEFKRENGYRHPPLFIVTLARAFRREDHAEHCMKNTHVHEFELIEGSFDSKLMVRVVFSMY